MSGKDLKLWLAAFFVLFLSLKGAGQEILPDSLSLQASRDSVKRYFRYHPRQKMSPQERKMKVLPIYGVNYTQETQFSVIGGFSGMYRTVGAADVPLSQIGFAASVSTNLSLAGAVTGINYASEGRFMATYSLRYDRLPLYFWGIGYENGADASNKSTFKNQRARFRSDLLYRNRERLYAGGFLSCDFTSADDFSDPQLAEGLPRKTRYISVGARFDYDTRDRKGAPEKGVYLNVEQSLNFSLLSPSVFSRTMVVADFYFPTWEGCVFAVDLFGEINSEAAPWTLWPESGGSVRMRGYYAGRYRDRNMLSAQLEIRQRIWRMHGIAVWGGAANLFPSFGEFEIKNTLPTYGAGYRLDFLGLIWRIDAGFGRGGVFSIVAGVNHSF